MCVYTGCKVKFKLANGHASLTVGYPLHFEAKHIDHEHHYNTTRRSTPGRRCQLAFPKLKAGSKSAILYLKTNERRRRDNTPRILLGIYKVVRVTFL